MSTKPLNIKIIENINSRPKDIFQDSELSNIFDVRKENIVPDIAKSINPINVSFIPIYNFWLRILL